MASEEGSEVQEVDISKLNIKQLSQLTQQLEEELSVFQVSLQSLKMVQRKYTESKESLEKLTPESDGKQIMVPLSGCIYVPGKISNPNSVIIDIGTGYYVEKDLDGARDYFKRRIAYITEQMEKFQEMGIDKMRKRDVIKEVREIKIRAELSKMSNYEDVVPKSAAAK